MVKNSATFQNPAKSQPKAYDSVPGTLYIVAMPIGNREDITLRALSILKSVDGILAEDTRHSLPLLTHLMIQKPLFSFHAYNEEKKSHTIIESLEEGKSFALISDAGTPLISDPGFSLVRLARSKNIPVVPIPGACALITALCAAGVPCNEFTFVGFLSSKAKLRKEQLNQLKNNQQTIILYESSHRIKNCVEDIVAIYGSTYEFVLAKELTKLHEHFSSGTGSTILDWLKLDPNHLKGEFVLILPSQPQTKEASKEEEILKLLLEELPLKQAVSIACKLTHGNKNALYQLALKNIK